MSLPTGDVPLYNHTLSHIETWLRDQDCEQDSSDRNVWHVCRETWRAELELDTDKIIASYERLDGARGKVQRSFPYALSRIDLESAIFAGP
ncbi:MAG: DUF3143 domain-containing protein [Synechococcales cyanobacterium RM1_1_8]|nr:DUF3143 domain-containing protein [Synechococcales cyanobacterium RM1_1_8]